LPGPPELRVQTPPEGLSAAEGLNPMSIQKAIDQIVEAFIPEMEKISKTSESEAQKERHYKAWLRATLQKFADDVRDVEACNKDSHRHDEP
jgi:hypothetical protein